MTQQALARPTGTPLRKPSSWPTAWPLLLFLGFALLDLVVLRGALHGPFVSDDEGYIVTNPYIRELSMENLAAIFEPGSPAQIHAVGNYSQTTFRPEGTTEQENRLMAYLYVDHEFINTLGMTVVILMVFPHTWANEQLPWSAMALALIAYGPGRASFDFLIARSFGRA